MPLARRTDAVRILMLGWEFPPFIAGGLAGLPKDDVRAAEGD